MRRLFATAPLLAMILAGGCSSPAPTPPALPATPTLAERLPEAKTGEFLLTPYDRLLSESVCSGTKGLPQVSFQQQTVSPETVAPGEQFSHTLVYTVCANDLAQFVGGTLYRKIYLGKRLVHSEPKPLDLKPGRWQLKAVIEVPPGSKSGSYELRTEFVGSGASKNRVRLHAASRFEIQG